MIEINDIHFQYPDGPKVLHGLSFEVRSQEILGILGPNGSGKTTLLNVMSGLLSPDAGNVMLDEQSIASMHRSAIAQQIAHIPQSDGIELDFSVWEIVMMGRQPYQSFFGFDSPEDCEFVEHALKATETFHLKERSIQSLSGGERRRVLIARGLAQNTPSMLLDEPTTHMDIHYQGEICELLLRLCNEQQRAIVMTVHDINLAALYCDRILLLSEGRIEGIGTAAEVITQDAIDRVFNAAVIIDQDPQTQRPYYRHRRQAP